MKPKGSTTCLLLLSLLVSLEAAPHDQELGTSFRGSKTQFSFERNKKTLTLRLNILINGWAVNCARTRAIVWGINRGKEQLGVPPWSKIYIIDLKRAQPMNHFTRTHGTFGASFSMDQKMAIVDDDVVDLATGKVINQIYYMNKLDLETCPSFPGKQSD
ncbi:hypothetical protein J2S30_001151 [Herbaspirillum rubrisubalbicans]|uniref:hypothetical protein n=1 Tax=Herbaspirillum rubrisubalbicans TaxID=80842 RepID=UPI00209CCDAB|nr:hypothetical protein [Herbaspirillum rubrisubalbicans]MCP1572772.1 hypothetical protein [Herbaspirillum rubrisubalbicans]